MSAVGVIQRFVPRGFDVVAYDSRAHGESDGDACTYGFFEKQDLRRVLDTVRPGATDGTFSATLPDFARDAVIRSFERRGELAFCIRDQKTGNPLFRLKPAGHSLLGTVPLANGYPGQQMFDAEVPR
jgi:hypothetical protein